MILEADKHSPAFTALAVVGQLLQSLPRRELVHLSISFHKWVRIECFHGAVHLEVVSTAACGRRCYSAPLSADCHQQEGGDRKGSNHPLVLFSDCLFAAAISVLNLILTHVRNFRSNII